MIKLMLLSALTLFPFMYFQYKSCILGNTYYYKTTGSSNSLITGCSRESTGIVPTILQEQIQLENLPKNIALDVYTSPYGEKYLSFIKDKLSKTKKKSIHIIGVAPGYTMNKTNEKVIAREDDKPIYRLFCKRPSINLEFILRHSGYPFYIKTLKNWLRQGKVPKERKIINHSSGWSENILVESYRVYNNPEEYFMTSFIRNKEREEYLDKTINYLKKSGIIFLIRMPISEEVRKYELSAFPEFDNLMVTLTSKEDIHYLNYSDYSDYFQYFDKPGHHLVSESAKKFTTRLANDIKTILNSQTKN